jgi:hypothetical protein
MGGPPRLKVAVSAYDLCGFAQRQLVDCGWGHVRSSEPACGSGQIRMLLHFWQRGSPLLGGLRQAPSATSNEHPASTAQAGVITVRSERLRETAFMAIPSAK